MTLSLEMGNVIEYSPLGPRSWLPVVVERCQSEAASARQTTS
jgi:hypothetical protein